METVHYTKADDQVDPGDLPDADVFIDPAVLAGTWINTNRHTEGIVKVVIALENGVPTVQAFGACEPEPCDWGVVQAKMFAENASSRTAKTLSAVYDFGFMETSLQAFGKLGVLVVAIFTRFKDGSGRAPYFDREFFYEAHTAASDAS